MKRPILILIIVAIFAATPAFPALVQTNGAAMQIVRLQLGADVDRLVRDFGLTPRFIYRHALNGFAATMDDATIAKLRADGRVRAVDLDDAKFVPCGQVVPSGVVRMGLTNFPMTRLNGLDNHRINVNVAVLDTGIQIDTTANPTLVGSHPGHPDLNVVQAAGFADPGYNGDDWNGHGTYVAGILGALDNDFGVVGVAPGVNLWSVQVLGPTQSGAANVIAGLDYVAQHADEIEVVNASLGGVSSTYQAVHEAVSNLVSMGVVFLASAGNGSADILGNGTQGGPGNVVPAAFPEVMAVSAMDSDPDDFYVYNGTTNRLFDTFWNSSNYSLFPKVPTLVTSPGLGMDVTAPGVNIFSTWKDSSYATNSGTSAAAPHVAGLVALYIAANGRAHSLQDVIKIRQAIVDNGQPQSQWHPATPVYFGYPNDPGTGDPDGNYEPLAIASENWIPQPVFSAITNTTSGFQLSFPAVPGYNYTVQSTPMLAASNLWSNLSTVTGSGSVATVTLTDTNLAAAAFYRLVRQPAP